MAEDRPGTYYEKCAHCHLFVMPNPSIADPTNLEGLAPHLHLHRDDEADEALDESHEAEPSGQKATLSTWEQFGPLAMRQRFTDYDPKNGPHVLITDDGQSVTITTHENEARMLTCLRENFASNEDVGDDDLIDFITSSGVLVTTDSI